MAGDWIKMRTDLNDDPAVVLIASLTGIDEDSVVGKLHHLWCWADKHTTDGTAPAITHVWVDRYVRHKGFAEAMVKANWLAFTEYGVVFPNFDRHNGNSAKVRAEATLRQRLSRKNRDDGVTGVARTPIPRPFTKHVLERDGYQCVYCGTQSTAGIEASIKKKLSIDHIKPESRGGSASVENLATCCHKCNVSKNDRTPEEWGVSPTYLQTGVHYVNGQLSQDCHAMSVTNPLPEKRREEKRREEENKTPQPPKGGGDLQQEQVASGESDKTAKGNAKTPPLAAVASVLEARGFGGVEFANALAGFYRHRKEMGRPITMNTAAALAAKFESVGQARAIQAMRDSVANGWQGVFPEKTTGAAARPPGSTSVEEAVAEMQRRREANERRTA